MASGDWNRIPEITNVCSTQSEGEPDLPQTFVACRCGHLNPLHAAECEDCGNPHPRHTAQAIRCTQCGDEDAGPWLVRDGRLICEDCDERGAA